MPRGKMFVVGAYKMEEILPHLGSGMPKLKLSTRNYGDILVKTSSTRLECLKRSQECVRCGLKGTKWLLESSRPGTPRVGVNCHISDSNCPWCALRRKQLPPGVDNPHLNLYGFTKSGRKILFTQDHIFPKHAGGSNGIENLQTMCQCCNSYKGGMLPGEYLETMNERERARHFRSMDGRGPALGGLPSLHSLTDEQANHSDCAAE